MNAVAPGPVMTDAAKVMKVTDAAVAHMISMTRAADRIGTTDDIADAVILLASEKSRWITGQYVSASGGMTGL